MSSYRYSRFLLRTYPHLAMVICALLTVFILEEFGRGEKIDWKCPICERRKQGIYTDNLDKHPRCGGYENGKAHPEIKMMAVIRE